MTTRSIDTPAALKEAYHQTLARIAAAAERTGRRASDVHLVAVTKYATPDQIRTLVELGQADLGENRVQHLAQRVAQLEEFLMRKRTLGQAAPGHAPDTPSQVRWHMIGHLQRNKVKAVVPLVAMVHSVDSLRLAEELHALGARTDTAIDVLLQVNASGEASKFGVAPPAVIHLAEQIDTMMHLRLRGLMTIAPQSGNPEDARPTFTRAAELFRELQSSGVAGEHCNILSMGMTDDFEVAIEEGANLVRIGRALFGEHDEA